MYVGDFTEQLIHSRDVVAFPLTNGRYYTYDAYRSNDGSTWTISRYGGDKRDVSRVLCTIDVATSIATVGACIPSGTYTNSSTSIDTINNLFNLSSDNHYHSKASKFPFAPARFGDTGVYKGMQVDLKTGEPVSPLKKDLVIARSRVRAKKALAEEMVDTIHAASKLYGIPDAPTRSSFPMDKYNLHCLLANVLPNINDDVNVSVIPVFSKWNMPDKAKLDEITKENYKDYMQLLASQPQGNYYHGYVDQYLRMLAGYEYLRVTK